MLAPANDFQLNRTEFESAADRCVCGAGAIHLDQFEDGRARRPRQGEVLEFTLPPPEALRLVDASASAVPPAVQRAAEHDALLHPARPPRTV